MYKDPTTGEQKSISSRCAELDTEIPYQLGVSKAILENVIFCHQEDSNWPLSEPSILKKKFDDIFASTKYTKVIDNIKNYRKEQLVNIRIHDQEIHYLEKDKQKAKSLRTNLSEIKEKANDIKERLYDIERNEIDTITEEINNIEGKIQEVSNLQSLLRENEYKKELANKNIEELSNIKIYSETDDELNSLFEKYSKEMRNFNENQSTYNKELEKAKKEETSLNNSQMSILTQRGRYEAEMETYETVKKRKNNLIINLKKKHNIINDKEDINDILDLIKKENSKSNQELQNFEEISKKKENSINEKINNLKSQLFINERNKKEYESKYVRKNNK